MDLVLGRGAKCSYFLIPKTSRFSFKLSSCFYKHPKVISYQQTQYLETHTNCSCLLKPLGTCAISTQYSKICISNSYLYKVSSVQYSDSTKSNSTKSESTKSDSTKSESTKSESTKSDSTKSDSAKSDSTKSTLLNENQDKSESIQKPSIFQRMKQMTKDYWHILIPVHIVTSLGWLSIFYFAAKNGVDIVGILESLNLSERYLEMLRGSSAGHWAVTYALYKIFTPLRYTVTVGGTTMCIRYLNKWGYLKFKKNIKLVQSRKIAETQKTAFEKSSLSNKNPTQSQKT